MKGFIGWIVLSFLTLITVLLIRQGLGLWSLGTDVAGDGIGVHFLGLEINDRVSEKNIPSYSIGFFICGIIAFLLTIPVVIKNFYKR
jgi:hypothetical protein